MPRSDPRGLKAHDMKRIELTVGFVVNASFSSTNARIVGDSQANSATIAGLCGDARRPIGTTTKLQGVS